jgi:hypothetical protein
MSTWRGAILTEGDANLKLVEGPQNKKQERRNNQTQEELALDFR